MLCPARKTYPSVNASSPVIHLKVVVLPAPLIPSNPKHCPSSTHKETSSIATVFSPFLTLKTFLRFLITIGVLFSALF
jgi:hypothetical protein